MALATPPAFRGIGAWPPGGATRGPRPWGLFFLGLMMGLLPCGLSFAAFARALACGSPLVGGALVFSLGLGTVPGLFVLGTGFAGLVRRYRAQSEILSGLLMIAMAALLSADAIGAIG